MRSVPVVTRSLVAVNVLVFTTQLLTGARAELLVRTFGFVPARLMQSEALGRDAFGIALSLIGSLFLHGGVVHLLGNMIYLWVFGGAIEDALGRRKYLFVYITCGVAGSLAHASVFPASTIPSIGASGSIAGVLGAFFVLRPHARIVTLFPLVIYWAMAEIPAALFLPVWFGMQFFNGFLMLASARGTQDAAAGVAWWAHIGGFAFGVALAALLRPRSATRSTT